MTLQGVVKECEGRLGGPGVQCEQQAAALSHGVVFAHRETVLLGFGRPGVERPGGELRLVGRGRPHPLRAQRRDLAAGDPITRDSVTVEVADEEEGEGDEE